MKHGFTVVFSYSKAHTVVCVCACACACKAMCQRVLIQLTVKHLHHPNLMMERLLAVYAGSLSWLYIYVTCAVLFLNVCEV